MAVNGNPSHSYGVSLAIWDHTVLPATRHKWTHPALTSQSGRYSIYLPWRDGRLSWPRGLVPHPTHSEQAVTVPLCPYPWVRVCPWAVICYLGIAYGQIDNISTAVQCSAL